MFSHFCFQRKDAPVGQSVIASQGVHQHLVNSQTVSPHLVNSPAVPQHLMGGQAMPLSQHLVSSQSVVSHMMSRHALGGHLVTSQPVMSSGITVSSGLQQVPCCELFVGWKHRLRVKMRNTKFLSINHFIGFICLSLFTFCPFAVSCCNIIESLCYVAKGN